MRSGTRLGVRAANGLAAQGSNAISGARAEEGSPAENVRRLSRADWFLFGAVVLLAFCLRLIHLNQARAVVFFNSLISDGQVYDEWAQRIAKGDWLGSGVFYQAPLYPYFLAVMESIVGHDLWRLRLVQIVLGSFSCGLLLLAGRCFFSRRVGAVAGLAIAIYPPAIFFDALIQKAVLDLFSASLLLCLLGRALRNRPTVLAWAGIGMTLAILVLTRENAILLIVPVAAWLWFHFRGEPARRRLGWLGGFGGGLAGALLPVGVRNLVVGGEFALTTSQAGPNLYIGNNPRAVGVYEPLLPGRSAPQYERLDATELAQKALGRSLSPGEVSHYWVGQAFAFIREQPAAWVGLMARKCMLGINWYETPDAEDIYFYERDCGLIRGLGHMFHFGMLFPLAVVGMVLSWPRRQDVWLLYALLGTIYAATVLFYVFARYRYPMVPFLVLFAAAGLVELGRAVRARATVRLVAAGIAGLVAAIAANQTIRLGNGRTFDKESQLTVSLANAGYAMSQQNRLDKAIEYYRAAVQTNPRFMGAHYQLGKTYLRIGRIDEAIASLSQALELEPAAARTQIQLGIAMGVRGETERAINLLERGLRESPDDADGLKFLGQILFEQRKWGAAIERMKHAVKVAPDDNAASLMLASALSTCPDATLRDPETAVRLGETVCTRLGTPDAHALDVLAGAYAAAGRFEEAAAVGRRALDMAERGGGPSAAEISSRLKLYEAKQAYYRP